MRFIFLFFCFTLSAEVLHEVLIERVNESIEKAELQTSNLDVGVLKIDGMSSARVRHFLNNLCSFPETSYLEIGCWKGSTLVSALYKNDLTVTQAVAIDNWSEFKGPRDAFFSNVNHFLTNPCLQILEIDCFTINKEMVFSKPINVYFYDGNHSALSQELAFTYYDDIFDNVFIAVIDDWNCSVVRRGTRSAFEKLGYEILHQRELFTSRNGDGSSWWNGLYIAVISKKRSDALPNF